MAVKDVAVNTHSVVNDNGDLWYKYVQKLLNLIEKITKNETYLLSSSSSFVKVKVNDKEIIEFIKSNLVPYMYIYVTQY